MGKFTPGPWKIAVYDHATKGARAVTRIETGADTIGEVFGLWREGLSIESARDEKQANARLIAAAPALFEALSRIISDLPTRRDWLDPDLEAMAKDALKAAGKEI